MGPMANCSSPPRPAVRRPRGSVARTPVRSRFPQYGLGAPAFGYRVVNLLTPETQEAREN